MDDYEMSSAAANITIGAYGLTNGTEYTVDWEVWEYNNTTSTKVDWAGWNWVANSENEEHFTDVSSVGQGCYEFVAILFDEDASEEIENESWHFTIDEEMEDCQSSGYWPDNTTRFVYIRTSNTTSDQQTPYTLHFSASPMADNSPYNMTRLCNTEWGDDDDVWEGYVPTDFNSVTSWSVKNVNDIQLGQFVSYDLPNATSMSFPMIVFEQNSSISGHAPSTLSDSDYYPCQDGGGGSNGTNVPEIGIVEYQSEDASSHQYCWDSASGCPLDITDLEDGWINITIEAWDLDGHDSTLGVSSWVDEALTNSFTVSVNGTNNVAVTLPFWIDDYTCSVEIYANLEVGSTL